MNCTIDASVFVAAVRLQEQHYAVSREFLQQVQAQAVNVFCPTLAVPECAAAIARPTGDSTLAEELVALVEGFSRLHLIALEPLLARRAAQIAIAHRLRGADATYVAVAEAFEATLITWDTETLERGSAAVATITPAAWMEDQRQVEARER